MLKGLLRYYHTIKFLRWTQIKHQVLYKFIQPEPNRNKLHNSKVAKAEGVNLKFQESIVAPCSYQENNTFKFLNITHKFSENIDWNISKHGKLWVYNLNYFEYLSQSELTRTQGLELIDDFIRNEETIKDGMEPFPISLRTIFWIKFLLNHGIVHDHINASLLWQLKILSARPEYHLMGNHLLENGFSLLFGGCYLGNKEFVQQAKTILIEQLDEQILPDGAHFELSPMYHCLILYRILDSINLIQENPQLELKELLDILQDKAAKMLGWLQQMIFGNGSLPRVNDSVDGISPNTKALFDYAQRLEISIRKLSLSESGYRKRVNNNFELLVDVGRIGPDYIPGHSHSDTLNFILHFHGKPMIVDTGVSTYEKNQKRNQERSTSAHNTVAIAGGEQSEVWGGFRVARRANVFNLEESTNLISASHDGYFRIHTFHQRSFSFEENSITIIDKISKKSDAKAYLHFHPDVEVSLVGNELQGASWRIVFEDTSKIQLLEYQYAEGFNKTRVAQKAVLSFKDTLCTKIIGE